jgi:predicted HTH domain antitoxin
MNISFEIPHEIEQQIRTNGLDVSGKAREAFLVELYREHKISHRQLGDALGLERYETDGLLKKYGVGLSMSVEEIKAEAGLLRDVRPA